MKVIKRNFDIDIKKILVILIYKLSLDLIYATIISKYFAYSQFTLNIELYKYLISTFVILIIAKPVYNLIKFDKPSNIMLPLFNILYFIPGTTLYALNGLNDLYFLFFVAYWILLLFFQYKINFKIKKSKILKNKVKDYRYVIVIICFFVLSAIFISGFYNNFKLNFSLSNVYDLRKEAKEVPIPTILQYIRTWASKIIPIGLTLALLKKKRIISSLFILVQLLLFSFDGMRTSLFILFLVIFVYFFVNKKSYSIALPGFTIIGVLFNIVGLIIQKCPLIVSYLHRRIMFLPNLLSNYYFEFFSKNELLFLRQSVVGKFGLTSPYNQDIGYIISDFFFQKPDMNSCNGLLGDAFANFGWYSLLFYPLMLIVVLKVIDFVSENIDMKIIFVVCIELFISFTNQSFFTSLLTGGTIVIIILLMLFPKDKNINSDDDLYNKLENKITNLYHKVKIKLAKDN